MSDPDLRLKGGDAFEGWTMNVEFCKENSGSAQKMRYFRKIKGGGGGGGGGAPPWAPSLDPPLKMFGY